MFDYFKKLVESKPTEVDILNQRLLQAILDAESESTITQLIKEGGADPNVKITTQNLPYPEKLIPTTRSAMLGLTPMHLAVLGENPILLKALAKNGGKIDIIVQDTLIHNIYNNIFEYHNWNVIKSIAAVGLNCACVINNAYLIGRNIKHYLDDDFAPKDIIFTILAAISLPALGYIYLKESGVILNAPNPKELTPCQLALQSVGENEEVIKVLLENGAEPKAPPKPDKSQLISPITNMRLEIARDIVKDAKFIIEQVSTLESANKLFNYYVKKWPDYLHHFANAVFTSDIKKHSHFKHEAASDSFSQADTAKSSQETDILGITAN